MKKLRFTIKLKILSITILIVVCLLVFVILVNQRMNTLQQETDFITHHDREITNLTNQIEKNILDMESGQRGYVITGDDKYLGRYRQGRTDWGTNYDELAALNNSNTLQLNRLQSIRSEIEDWIELSGQHVIQLKKEGQDAAIIQFFGTDASMDQMDRIRSQMSIYREAMNENTNLLISGQADQNKLLLELLYFAWAVIAAAAVSASWLLARSVSDTTRKITATLMAMTTSRDLGTRVILTTNDEISDLGRAANLLLDTQQERVWLQERANEMMAEYQGITRIPELGEIYLGKTAQVIDYPYSALYIRSQESGQDLLTRVAVFAGKPLASEEEAVSFGEGLVGQCAKEARLMHTDHLPDHYISIESGLGASSPRSLLLMPVKFLGEVLAVVEIASFAPLSEQQLLFLESISDHFGAALNSTVSSMKIDVLLEQSQRLNEELQVFTEELQAQSEELHTQTNTLQSTNKKLEEKQILAEQKTGEAEKAQEELTQYAKMLQQSTKYKSEFLANMSHELRTPLNGILLLSEFLTENQSGLLGAEEIEFSRAIHSSGEDLLALINDILDLSKVEAGKMNIEIEAVSVQEIKETVELNFGQLSRKKGIPLYIQLSPGLPEVIYTDSQRLRQILSNLLSNAFKFTAQGTVSFGIGLARMEELEHCEDLKAASYMVFTVKDTGIGVAENNQALIFEAFQQADGNTERRYGGTGLGLSITKELTALLGGKIRLESIEGTGSTFSVYLPLGASQAMDEDINLHLPQQSVESPKRLIAAAQADLYNDYDFLQHKRVLIVDDDERNLFALTRILGKYGLEVSAALDGQQALRFLEDSAPVDMILMDIMMPVMDGFETIQRIREIPLRQFTPIIALTAKAMQEDRTKILEAGATEYLSKPVNMDQLLALMKLLISSDI